MTPEECAAYLDKLPATQPGVPCYEVVRQDERERAARFVQQALIDKRYTAARHSYFMRDHITLSGR